MSKRRPVDVTRTDEAYWKQVLDAEGLGMNRGTAFLKDKDDIEAQKEEQNNSVPKNKGGRPRKTGPKGRHLEFTKLNAEASTRFTRTLTELSGIFKLGGFRNYGPSLPFGAGRGKKGGRRGPEDYGHFITYVGNAGDIARLEESLSLEETGRVTPSGYGADR